jgi:hypothetical protein
LALAGWSKGEFSVQPYGSLWTDVIFETSRTSPAAFTLWVPSRATEGEPAFVVDTRRSRFGLQLNGSGIPAIGIDKSHGQLEIDFHGDFVTENRPSVLLRHCYWEVQNEEFRLLVGQYWDVISPLLPGTLNYAAGWNAGNIGFRRAQLRGERYWQSSDASKWTIQMSLNQDVVVDFPTDPGVHRESAGWPVIEGRLAAAFGPDRGRQVGVSSHIGETGFDFLLPGPPPLSLPPADDRRYQTWSFNLDLLWPLSERWTVSGELFTGANLSTFLGGIGQGVCPCLRVPIRTSGGWIDAGYTWSETVTSHFGFGLDDPRDNDSLVGRTYNQQIYANILFHLTEYLSTGLEVASWKTLYHDERVGQIPPALLTPTAPGDSVTFQWMFKYDF